MLDELFARPRETLFFLLKMSEQKPTKGQWCRTGQDHRKYWKSRRQSLDARKCEPQKSSERHMTKPLK